MPSQSTIPQTTYLACSALLYDWAYSVDNKAWPKLRSLFAPTVAASNTDTDTGRWKAASISGAEYVAALSDPAVLGREDIKVQHLVGAQKWSLLDNGSDRVRCEYQMRATHFRADDTKDERGTWIRGVKATAHGWDVMDFEEVDGEWKIVNITVDVMYIDGDWDAVFAKRE